MSEEQSGSIEEVPVTPEVVDSSDKLPTTEDAIAKSLGYPDYRRFTRAGDEGRLLETKLLEAPRIFCPVILDVEIQLDKSRNNVPLMDAEIPEVIRGYLGVSEDLIIDVLMHPSLNPNRVLVTLRSLPVPSIAISHRGVSRVHHVSLLVTNVLDTLDDSLVSRRHDIIQSFVLNTQADSLVLCLPQSWLIPDPDFKTKLPTLPVYPNSAFLLFFKNLFGHVVNARILFKHSLANLYGCVALLIQFKEHRPLRQALLTLHDRYLVHFHAGNPDHPFAGMRMVFPRPAVFDHLVAEAEGRPGPPALPKSVAMLNSLGPAFLAVAPPQAASAVITPPVGDEAIATAFRQILEKLEKLESENQQLVELLATSTTSLPADRERDRERSPRSSALVQAIPSQGLPPWKRRP